MYINFQPISNVLGALMILLGGCMIATSGSILLLSSTDLNALLLSGGLSAIVGVALWFVKIQ